MKKPTRNAKDCKFCCDERDLMLKAPLDGDSHLFDCDRWLYKNDHCIVTLAPTQLSMGHAIAVLWNHSEDITDANLLSKEHHGLIDAVQKVARRMKQKLSCERVYVATLCDGVKHLAYHIIPRYKTDITGFAFIGQREFDRQNGYWIGPMRMEDRKVYLERLAKRIRIQ